MKFSLNFNNILFTNAHTVEEFDSYQSDWLTAGVDGSERLVCSSFIGTWTPRNTDDLFKS